MDRMKTRFIIAVTDRLSAAQDSAAKVDLIEELSENLYQRYLDLTVSGVAEELAYAKALEDLGDVEELLAYLKNEDGPVEAERGAERSRDYAGDFARSMEEIVRETISQTKDAVDQAKIIVRDVGKKLKEKYPNGFQGNIDLHFNDEYDDDHGEHPYGEDHEDEEGHGWSISMGYDKSRGFFCERSKSRQVEGTTFPSADIKAIDVELTNGDVRVYMIEDEQADAWLEGDTDQLEVRISEAGTLMIRQGRTASSNFFFGRGLASADAELHLPRRLLETVRISTVNGDVDLEDGLEAGELLVKTTSGDFSGNALRCSKLAFKSVSGDMDVHDVVIGSVQSEILSGDIELSGEVDTLRINTASGDIRFSGKARDAQATSASGDVVLECESLPERAELGSKSGDCRLSVPDGEGFTLQYSTTSGDMTSDFPLTGTVGSTTGTATYQEGGTSTLSISSISGDITLERI